MSSKLFKTPPTAQTTDLYNDLRNHPEYREKFEKIYEVVKDMLDDQFCTEFSL